MKDITINSTLKRVTSVKWEGTFKNYDLATFVGSHHSLSDHTASNHNSFSIVVRFTQIAARNNWNLFQQFMDGESSLLIYLKLWNLFSYIKLRQDEFNNRKTLFTLKFKSEIMWVMMRIDIFQGNFYKFFWFLDYL